jgi:DNA-binding CsgD family transcriptional regulator
MSRKKRVHVSPREAQILSLIASGLHDKEIGAQLGISPRTIETYLQRLYLEFGVRTRAAAVAAWLRLEDTSKRHD